MAQEQIINGISATALDKMILDIYDYAEKSNKIINEIDSLVSETKNYFICEAGDSFRSKYDKLSSQKHSLNKNILSYTSDLTSVKEHYVKRTESAAEFLNSAKKEKDVERKNRRGE